MKTKYYAVFVRKVGIWIKQSIDFTDYKQALEHAKLVRRAMLFIEKTRVKRV